MPYFNVSKTVAAGGVELDEPITSLCGLCTKILRAIGD